MPLRKKISLSLQETHAKQWDSTFQLMDWWDPERIAAARVMVVGAGALGNEVLKNLTLLNVGHIFIVDFDEVEYGNLNRSILFRENDCGKDKAEIAAQQIKTINPNIKVQYIKGDISIDVGLGIFRRMDVVIGCLDNRVARLFINRHCNKVNKTWIDGAIENLSGQLDVFKPEHTCYECQLTAAEMEIINFRLGCADVAQRNANFGTIPTTPISSSVIGAIQVQEALKVIFGDEKNSMVGKSFRFFGKTGDTLYSKSPPLKTECYSHLTYDPILEIQELSCYDSVSKVLEYLRQYFDDPKAYINLDEEVVLEVLPEHGSIQHVAMLKYHFSEEVAAKYKTTADENLRFEKTVTNIDDSFPYPEMSLNQIGVPPLQILKVESRADFHFVELTGDQNYLDFQ